MAGGGAANDRPIQVEAGIRWLVDHAVTDLLSAGLPWKGSTTTVLRLRQRSVPLLDADRESEHRRTVVRFSVLNLRYRGGIVDLSDVRAPWLLCITQAHSVAMGVRFLHGPVEIRRLRGALVRVPAHSAG